MDASQTSALVSPSFSPRLANSALKGPSSNWALTLKQLKGRYLHIASEHVFDVRRCCYATIFTNAHSRTASWVCAAVPPVV
jgi:hypothetical protein